ncbi:MAG TPA: GNAT family N-acetyltransferase [Bacteroidota bacterium]|nr:GNAT family N-acetyltransferase [Bacteroidota bacterium]
MTIDVVESLERFRALGDQWNRLAVPFKTPLLRHEWFLACAETFCPPGKLDILIAQEGGEIVAIAPLVLNPLFGVRRLEILGTRVLEELSGFLYADQESLVRLLGGVLSRKRPILFSGLLSDSPELKILKQAGGSSSGYSQSSASASPWIPVTTSWEQFYKNISSSWRSSLRRSQRRAEEMGSLQFEIVAPTPETVEPLLSEMFQVESAGWKARTGTALQTSAVLGKFFQTYALSTARLGMLRFAFLRIGGKAVAAQFLVVCAQRLWVLKVGFDETYSRCSPGILLMHKVIEHCFEKQYEAFELLGANESWLSIWKPQLHIHETYRLYPVSLLPLVSHAIEISGHALGRVRTLMKKQQDGTPWRLIVKKAIQRLRRLQHPAL